MISERIIKLARAEAEKSQHRFRLGAVCFRGSKIISKGYNQADKTHPQSKTYGARIHAEFDAIRKAKFDVRGCSIYVHRLKRNNSVGLAKPCSCCDSFTRSYGIKNIFYSK